MIPASSGERLRAYQPFQWGEERPDAGEVDAPGSEELGALVWEESAAPVWGGMENELAAFLHHAGPVPEAEAGTYSPEDRWS